MRIPITVSQVVLYSDGTVQAFSNAIDHDVGYSTQQTGCQTIHELGTLFSRDYEAYWRRKQREATTEPIKPS